MEILIEELKQIQEKYGYLPETEIIKCSEKNNITKAEIYGVISFYSRFYLKPHSKYIIRVCKSIACGMNRNKDIIKKLKEIIGKEENNNRYSLELVECLGHCDKAPVMSINDNIYGEITADRVASILENHREGEENE